GVARQAASSLTTAHQQPVVNGAPVGNRPQSVPPVTSAPPQSRPPYPPVPRPVSGAQARGAASVPPAQQPYRHPSVPPMAQHPHQPQMKPQPQPQQGSGGRQVLIVLAVVLALLVLLCAGVISFLLNQGNTIALGGSAANVAVVRTGVAGEGTPATSYRLREQAADQRGLNGSSEGRHTL
ncbi:serine/threonine protein kinase, partial [Actinoplanes sp. NPDC051633]